MMIPKPVFLLLIFLNISLAWEYCQADIENKLCGTGKTHLICDAKNSIDNPSYISKKFLAHVPLTRKVKRAFINWHNYYRNRTAGGWAKNSLNKIFFPMAVRMRELIWDSELSYLSHFRSKLVNAGEATCSSTLRFPKVAQNLEVTVLNEPKPVLEIIFLALRKMFDEKNNIENPTEMPKEFVEDHEVAKQFTTIINDQVSRVGCAVALGADCLDSNEISFKYCYYTVCTYDFDMGGIIYKVGKPTGRCSRWGVGRSKTYINLCANSGEIFAEEN
ncbi:hypothetical protein FF38_14282 [Lucilia cuprina]|uniref:SCP domain-containing protein n=1 Tax=Lucilia cuprina TaxID=7375 RepID=A0A0L0CGA9_LUCCU|nr:Venom allergen 5 [Lucilia cuprina]KNC31281.1 hypothetical protein FF38_14282 [Lucilia cuprina]